MSARVYIYNYVHGEKGMSDKSEEADSCQKYHLDYK